MCSFKIYGIWPQADIHTTSANAVTLVWGSLRLAPIIMTSRAIVEEGIKSSGSAGMCGWLYLEAIRSRCTIQLLPEWRHIRPTIVALLCLVCFVLLYHLSPSYPY